MMTGLFGSLFIAQAAEPVSAGAALGAGLLILILGLLIYLCISGLFIHVAAGITSLGGNFGRAVAAVLWQILFTIIFAILLGMLSAVLLPLAPIAPFLANWMAVTLGIKQAYSCDFGKALLTGILAWLLAMVSIVVLGFILVVAGLFSLKDLPTQLQPEAMPQGVELRMIPELEKSSALRVA